MHTLTREQKIENLQEYIASCRAKIVKIEKTIEKAQEKLSKLEKSKDFTETIGGNSNIDALNSLVSKGF